MKVIFKHKEHDYPKKTGDINLAWYACGSVCVVRRKTERSLQKQNLSIIQINAICKLIWEDLNPLFKKDLALYALKYKKKYPSLRKRGISSYAVFLMIIHALIKRFSLQIENQLLCVAILKRLLERLSVKKAVQLRLLKPVMKYYQFNHCIQYEQAEQMFKKDLPENFYDDSHVTIKYSVKSLKPG